MYKNMNKNYTILPNIVSTAEVQRGFRKIMLQTKKSKSPTFVLNSNDPQGVLLDYDSWVDLVSKMNIQEEHDALEAVKIYKQEKKKGKLKILKSLTDLMD